MAQRAKEGISVPLAEVLELLDISQKQGILTDIHSNHGLLVNKLRCVHDLQELTGFNGEVQKYNTFNENEQSGELLSDEESAGPASAVVTSLLGAQADLAS